MSNQVRACLTGLTLGMLVVARTHSTAAVAVLTVIGVAAAMCLAGRAAIATLGILILWGMPWIASPLIAGMVWLIVKHRLGAWRWMRTSTCRIWGKGGLTAVSIGTAAGLAASPFARAQASVTPVVFDIVRPSIPVVLCALLALALANSVGEELLWRGALVEEARHLPATAQYTIQSLSFGVAHWHGLPGGFIGCLLTGVASLLFLWLHRRWGIAASILAHLIADLSIFLAVLPQVLFTGWTVASNDQSLWMAS